MEIHNLSTVNALLNGIIFILLIWGYRQIKSGARENHKKIMLSATAVSVLFLISYTIYHYDVGSVPYPHHDWRRMLYYIILAPHVILAALNVPFIVTLLILAFKGRYVKHKALAKYVWPLWIYVSVSGVVIYVMLYHL